MAEVDTLGITTMLTADAHLKVRANPAATFRCQRHQITDTFTVKHLEGILRQDAPFDVIQQEFTFSIITANAIRCLGEVIGAE